MIYIHNLQENLSLADILENNNYFFIKTENEKDLITNIKNNENCIFFIDYKNIQDNTELNKETAKNKQNTYIAIVSSYIYFSQKDLHKGYIVLKKPYSIQDITKVIEETLQKW